MQKEADLAVVSDLKYHKDGKPQYLVGAIERFCTNQDSSLDTRFNT